MHINPTVEIEPLGLFISTGMDTSIAFKFIAKTNDPKTIFDPAAVNSSKFKNVDSYYKFHEYFVDEDWWDVSQQKLNGGSFTLPDVKFLNLGYKPNDDDTITVYAYWHET